jgi:hypothetical protein
MYAVLEPSMKKALENMKLLGNSHITEQHADIPAIKKQAEGLLDRLLKRGGQ